MKTQFRSRLGWGIVPTLLLATFVFQGVGRTQPPPITTGTVTVSTNIQTYNTTTRSRVNFLSFATLFKNGEPVKSGEVTSGTGANDSIYLQWKDVPKGVYELHFETHGYGKVIKRVVVSSGEETPVILSAVSDKSEEMGMGPTLFELQRKVTLLENRMAAIEKTPK